MDAPYMDNSSQSIRIFSNFIRISKLRTLYGSLFTREEICIQEEMSCFGAIHCAGSALPCTFAKILHYQSSTADFLLPYSRLGHSLHFLQLEKFKHLARHRKTKLPANDPLEEDTDEEDLFGSKKRTSRQRARKREVKREVLTQYRDRFTKALRAELITEIQEMKDRLGKWSKQQLEDEGFALLDLAVQLDGHLYRDRILKFFKSHGDGLLPSHHQFSQGDVVFICRKNPLDEGENVLEGVVLDRARRFLRIVVSENLAHDFNVHLKWRLDLSVNHVAFQRCLGAVNKFSDMVIQNPAHHRGELKNNKARSFLDCPLNVGDGALSISNVIMGEAESRIKSNDLFLKKNIALADNGDSINGSPEAQVSMNSEAINVAKNPPTRICGKQFGSFKGSLRACLQRSNFGLNNSQRKAILAAASQRLTLWQGPPGTGKTKTLVILIAILCQLQQGKILACADSNVAVDNLVEGLLGQGLRVVRIGQPAKVKEDLRKTTLKAQCEIHPAMKMSHLLKREAELQRKQSRTLTQRKRETSAKEASLKWKRALDSEAEAVKEILDRAEVIAATCIGAGDAALDNQSFPVCVIDEASQATEPVTLVPILRSGAERIVLVGDPCQLPPTILSKEALEAGLDVSLFNHLQQCGLRSYLLDTQYRMHPALAAFPSAMFYSGHLASYPLPSDRPAPQGFKWPNIEKPLVFLECVSTEETTSEGNSFFNWGEALQVVKTVKQLLSGEDIGGYCQAIGVIAPYNAQVKLLQDLFFSSDNGRKFDGLEIKTVDGFQGREKEVIVLSTVRSNPEGSLGFLMDPRRMNVSLTRAKRGLVVIGNSKTLQFDEYWAAWLKHITRENLSITPEAEVENL